MLIHFCGKLFQSFTVLGIKEHLKQSLDAWRSINDLVCDLLVERWTGCSRFWTGMDRWPSIALWKTDSRVIFSVEQVFPILGCQSCQLHYFSYQSHFSQIGQPVVVQLQWWIWSAVYGSHTAAQYSCCGWTSERYARSFMSSVQPLKFLFMNPNDLFPLAVMWFMCLFHLSDLDTSTPRYECESVSWRIDWFKE